TACRSARPASRPEAGVRPAGRPAARLPGWSPWPGAAPALVALPVGVALLVERGDALGAVVGQNGAAPGELLELQPLLEWNVEAPVDSEFRLADADGGGAADLRGELARRALQPGARDHRRHHAPFVGDLGGHAASGEDHLLGPRHADPSREQLGPAAAR